MYRLDWKLIVQYCEVCKMYGWEPTWEGADAFRSMTAKQKPDAYRVLEFRQEPEKPKAPEPPATHFQLMGRSA